MFMQIDRGIAIGISMSALLRQSESSPQCREEKKRKLDEEKDRKEKERLEKLRQKEKVCPGCLVDFFIWALILNVAVSSLFVH